MEVHGTISWVSNILVHLMRRWSAMILGIVACFGYLARVRVMGLLPINAPLSFLHFHSSLAGIYYCGLKQATNFVGDMVSLTTDIQ